MYLFRSVGLGNLSESDKLRRSLISHFSSPYGQDEEKIVDLRKLCESPFEEEVYDILIQRGYRVIPQVKVGHFRIDMVVEGDNDCRIAVECDGDRFHGPDKYLQDVQRQRILERAGWKFWRSFASTFVLKRSEVIEDLLTCLKDAGIEPIGNHDASKSIHCEYREYQAFQNAA